MSPVPPEIALLGWSLVLVAGHIVLAAQLGNREHGLKWAAGPRDEPAPPPGRLLGRARRAQANLLETYPLFAAAVLAVAVTHRFDLWSLIGAHLYVWARVIYLPLYLVGAPLIRSLVWNVGLLGTFVVAAQLI